MIIQAIRVTFGVAWALVVLMARILGVALAIVGWLLGAIGIITRLAMIVLLLILIALLLHFFGGVNFAYAQDGTPPSSGIDVATAEARAQNAMAQAQAAQADAAAKQAAAQAAAQRAATLREQAEQAAAEAEQKRLAATQAEAQAALDRARAAQQAYEQAAQDAQQQEDLAGAALQRSADALKAANDAFGEMGAIKTDLAGKSNALASAQVALESRQAEIDSLNDVLRAERGMTMWLQGALLFVATAAIAALALISRRRPVTERVVERMLQPQVLIVPAEGGEPVDMTPREPGLTILNHKFAEQILKRYGTKDDAIYDQPTSMAG